MRLVDLELCEKKYIFVLPRLHFQMVPKCQMKTFAFSHMLAVDPLLNAV